MNETCVKARNALLKACAWTLEVLKKHIKVIYVGISMLLALLIISLVAITVEYNVTDVADIDSSELGGMPVYGYATSIDESGNIVFSPTTSDPQMYFYMGAGKEFNTVTLHFASPINDKSIVQAYYSYNGEDLSEPCSVKSRVEPDGMSVSLILPKTSSYQIIRIDVDDGFTLDSITLETTELIGIRRSASVGVIVALVVILAILGVTEKWLGFFGWVWSLIKGCYLSTKALFTKKTIAKLVVRVLLILSCATLVCSYTVILMTAVMTTRLIAYMFILTVITTGLFIADRVLSGNISAPMMFLVITVLCGFMLASLLPIEVSNCWDEEYHYARIIDMKILLFGDEETYSDLWQEQRLFALTTDRYLYSTESFIFNLINNDQTKHVGTLTPNLDYYKLLGHIPGAIAMAGADMTGLNYFAMFIIARMANVLTYAFIIYLGLKKLKSGALIISSVCLIPSALFIASTFSYDYFITAFVAYGMAYFISELQQPDKKFTLKDGILMLGAMVIGCGPKTIYLVLIFPMIFMSKKKFNTKRGVILYRVACVASMLIMLGSFILPFISNTASGAEYGDYRGGSGVDTTAQALFILENPWTYTKILLRFMGEYVSFTNAATMSVSYAYVGTGKVIWGTLALCIMAFCAFTDKSEGDDFKGVVKMKSLTVFTCFGLTALIATALYLSFTPVGLYTVNGCQWRYLIPVLIPFLYCVGSCKVRHAMDKRVINALVYGFLALNVFMTFYDVYISKIIPLK